MTLPDAITAYLTHVAANNESSTHETYALRLEKFSRWVNKRRVTRQLFTEWINHLLTVEKLSKRTVVHYRQTVRSFYAWLIENDFESKNPVGKIGRMPTPHSPKTPFTDDELNRILVVVADHDYWLYAVVFGNETGLRLSDVALMEWGNPGVNFEARSVRWMPLKTKRFQKFIEIPLSDSCIAVLEKMKLAAGASQFVSPYMAMQYGADAHRTLSMEFIRLAAKAHVYDKSFHHWRATAVTRWLKQNISPAVVATMSGHTLKEILTYATFTLEDKRKMMGLAVNQ